MVENESKGPGCIATEKLLGDFPDRRLVVEACVTIAEKTEGRFAGTLALQQAKKLGVGGSPKLRPLVRYGILRRTHVTRGGRRAYYVMPDVEGVKAALAESQPDIE